MLPNSMVYPSGLHSTRGAGGAARADDILDDELLAERARHVLAEDAGNDVGRSACRKRHDDRDRPRRIDLRHCMVRGVYCKGKGCGRENNHTFCHHALSPLRPGLAATTRMKKGRPRGQPFHCRAVIRLIPQSAIWATRQFAGPLKAGRIQLTDAGNRGD
jgi:hypothetical protein